MVLDLNILRFATSHNKTAYKVDFLHFTTFFAHCVVLDVNLYILQGSFWLYIVNIH